MLSPSLHTGIDLAAEHCAYWCCQDITSLPRHKIYYGGWHKVSAKWLPQCLRDIRGITRAHDTKKNLIRYIKGERSGLNTAEVSKINIGGVKGPTLWAFGCLMFWPWLLMSQRNTRYMFLWPEIKWKQQILSTCKTCQKRMLMLNVSSGLIPLGITASSGK